MLAVVAIACGGSAPDTTDEAPEPAAAATTAAAGVVDIRAEDYTFTAPPTFPSGWVTLRLMNEGEEPHFVSIIELPEGVTFDDYASNVSAPFDELYAAYRAGDLDQTAFFEKLGAAVPEWFVTARRAGGPGFTSPGRTSETMVRLVPGSYVMECYVRSMNESDTFHGKHGMLRPLIVSEASTSLAPPQADVEITLANYELTIEGDLSAGRHVARVRVEENPEGLVFHNVHLARLDGDGSAQAGAEWLDWVDFMLPPAPVELLGGAGQASAGQESYFAFELEPGRYAWMAELHGKARGMVEEFEVE
ncbi:MAG: hypothetical protein R3190_16760 [Thermoanaerobaculia bacterium]|nr:hypothetical protein [Thermoanaerobaculia bacterium]